MKVNAASQAIGTDTTAPSQNVQQNGVFVAGSEFTRHITDIQTAVTGSDRLLEHLLSGVGREI
jgi:hypothetical protein